MVLVTVSSRYQVTIPKDVRDRLHISKGQKMNATEHSGIITLEPVPVTSPEEHSEDRYRGRGDE